MIHDGQQPPPPGGAAAMVTALTWAGTRVIFGVPALSLIKIKQQRAAHGGGEAVDYGPVSYARAALALGAAAAVVRDQAALAAELAAALRRHGPTVIDAMADPAGYPVIMELSRGEAGRQPPPGIAPGGDRANAKERAQWP